MNRLEVRSFSISLDGYGAGPGQSFDEPLGTGGESLHEWMFATRTWARLQGRDGGETGVDDDYAARGFADVGAWIMGRNMFGPIRGPWPDESWQGWWGDEPPYHCPVFVLTHHARPPLAMAGGTTFHFVTDGIEAALERARTAAGDRDIRLGGGVATVRAYLAASLLEELHIAVAPVFLGRGEALWHGLDLPALGYRLAASEAGERATHLTIART
jgi:dihydrofolate reductase